VATVTLSTGIPVGLSVGWFNIETNTAGKRQFQYAGGQILKGFKSYQSCRFSVQKYCFHLIGLIGALMVSLKK